jgi:anti-sigma regulatory factor (Ser/Thr protein kinase)
MQRLNRADLKRWITTGATQHPRDLGAAVAQRYGVGRSTAARALRELIDAGWLQREGRSRPHYRPGALREVTATYALAGLDEQTPWERDFAPCLQLPVAVQALAHHAYTELLNNAIDHSGGGRVTVSMRCNGTHLHLLLSDDGCGVFERIRRAFGIDDPRLALLELSKGKLTTQPARHTGRGLFFTSRLFDVFDLYANGLTYQHSHWQRRDWLSANPLRQQPGTTVFASVALNTTRSLAQVYEAHAGHGGTVEFARTVVPLRLARLDDETLESRAQAKRLAARFDAFETVELDFAEIPAIGQAFADELFRVFPQQHPGVVLKPVNMNPAVAGAVHAACLQSLALAA